MTPFNQGRDNSACTRSSTNGSVCLQDAEAEGCITVSGLEMFVGQAAQQFELFTGQKAPIDLMRKATLDSMAGH